MDITFRVRGGFHDNAYLITSPMSVLLTEYIDFEKISRIVQFNVYTHSGAKTPTPGDVIKANIVNVNGEEKNLKRHM